MPVTKMQKLIFTLMMAFFMVGCMALYNSFLRLGFSWGTVAAAAGKAVKEYLFAVPIAFFFGSTAALALAKRFAPKSMPHLFPFVVSFFTVAVMVPPMTYVVSVLNFGRFDSSIGMLLSNMKWNYLFAMPIQILLVGPLVRWLFSTVCARL